MLHPVACPLASKVEPNLSCVWSYVQQSESSNLSVRHGPGAPGRPVYPRSDKEVLGTALACGLEQGFLAHTGSVQAVNAAAGVTWSWMGFKPA
jgi:hypothetical protein